jgi:metal-responsive CopG/Arc/MetJ family transcriptional regulator
MAKVMISLPEDLLEAVDRASAEAGESRSRFVRDALRARLAAGGPTPDRRRAAAARLREVFERYPAAESSLEMIRADRAR